MPFARNWTEELVAEWLQLDDFLVELNLPSIRPAVGGRYEPDIVGARVRSGKLEIRHCEVSGGIADNPAKVGGRYGNKFSQNICSWVKQHFMKLFDIQSGQTVDYEKWIIIGYLSKNNKKELQNIVSGVKLYLIHDFIKDIVLPSISAWKSRNISGKGSKPTLPQCMWLLQLLDYMNFHNMLK